MAELDIAAFLRARLDEREAKAKAATQGQFGRWMVDEGKHYQDGRARRIVTMAYDSDYALVGESAWPGEQVLTNCSFDHSIDEQEEVDLHFIADNDPEFVLADVAAKRQIIHEHLDDGMWKHAEDGSLVRAGPLGDRCSSCLDDGPLAAEAGNEFAEMRPYPCRTLRLLALPYAGHPDYREEWKP